MNKIITIESHILEQQRQNPEKTGGELTDLLNAFAYRRILQQHLILVFGTSAAGLGKAVMGDQQGQKKHMDNSHGNRLSCCLSWGSMWISR